MENTSNLTLTEAFNQKQTENGDIAFTTASDDNLVNILFLTEYYKNHLNEVKIDKSERDRLFAQFVRDPRNGMGCRELGRVLMHMSKCSIEEMVRAGRVDDLYIDKTGKFRMSDEILNYLKSEIEKGNELVKKWMPRYSSKNLMIARYIARKWGMNKQQYGHFIKCQTTVENKLSSHNIDDIEFDKLPSLALLKYYNRFLTKEDTQKRFGEYLDDVKSGKKELKISTTTVYDVYKNASKIDADLFFSKLEKISGSWIPVVDTSGSMRDDCDSMGKALSIGHYLSKCSSYAPNKVISFSSHPQLITLGSFDTTMVINRFVLSNIPEGDGEYYNEIRSMFTGDCSNTDFGKVMELLSQIGNLPEYIIVLSDMEFDIGSNKTKTEVEELWKQKGYNTKIIWWNFNSRNVTFPETDERGNIYMSGYSPYLLKYLETGFDGKAFLNKLLDEYKEKIQK